MADLKALADQLVGLTVKEVNELADILKEEHGIEPAAAAVAVAAGPAAAGGDAGAAEKSELSSLMEIISVFPKVNEKEFIHDFLFQWCKDTIDKVAYFSGRERITKMVEYYLNYPTEINSITFEQKLTDLQGISELI